MKIVKVSNKENYFNGNTVLVPEYNPSREYKDEKYRKLEKAKKEAQIKQKQLKTKNKVAVLRVIGLLFIIGIFLMYRYATIYKMEATLTDTKSQVLNLRAQNESLRVTLAQNSNINAVQASAVTSLNMVKPNAIDALKVDLTKNNFKPKKESNTTSSNIIDKIKKILF